MSKILRSNQINTLFYWMLRLFGLPPSVSIELLHKQTCYKQRYTVDAIFGCTCSFVRHRLLCGSALCVGLTASHIQRDDARAIKRESMNQYCGITGTGRADSTET